MGREMGEGQPAADFGDQSMDIVEGQAGKQGDDEFEVFIFTSGSKGIEVKARPTDTLLEVLKRAGVSVESDIAAFIAQDAHGSDDAEMDEAAHEGQGLHKTLGELCVRRGGRIVHSHCRWVEVTVNYQADSFKRRFRPSARVGRVLRWVVTKELHLKEEDFDVIKLKLCDGPDVRNDIRLAELLKHQSCSICFDLILTPRVQG